MQRAVIIGSGIIGLGIAVELVWLGVHVTLVDPRAPGTGASDGNTGWVVPALSAPIPAPGLPLQVMRWMLRQHSPFRIDFLSLVKQLTWLFSFWNHCDATRHRQGLLAQGRLNAESYDGFRRWADRGLDFEWAESGVTFVADDQGTIEHIAEELSALSEWGYESVERLGVSSLRDAHPEVGPSIQTGIRASREQYVRPESAIDALVREIQPNGRFVRAELDEFRISRRRVTGVVAGGEDIDAGAVVLAAGAWSGDVGRRLGFTFPILAGKGYSITVDQPSVPLSGPLYLADAKIACTPFRGANRFAGMMELTGPDDSIDPIRLLTMTTELDRHLPGWEKGTQRTMWAGLRPMSPDGLPLIGKIPDVGDVYVATGHGMLGVTMAPVTGEIIAEMIVDGSARHDISAFRPERFW
jgi:D-amino-acid dehydrogenase